MKNVNDLSRTMHEAFEIATTGRPGPVVVDIPKDVQFQTGAYRGPASRSIIAPIGPRTDPDLSTIVKAVEMMAAGEEADPLYRRRHHQFRPGRRSCCASWWTDRLSHHLDPDGAGRLPALAARMAGLLGMHGT